MDALLFDLFGTLVPVAPALSWPEQMRLLAEPLGMPTDEFAAGYGALTRDRMTGACTVTESIRQICASACVAVDETQLAAAVAAREEMLRKWLVPRPATLPALDRLRAAGVPLALVSDASSDAAQLWPDTPMAPTSVPPCCPRRWARRSRTPGCTSPPATASASRPSGACTLVTATATS
ncbi:MAG: hypothetical protein GEV07_09190 [Streptosporangiales bacterium]|nr:hypothetical protein [Streptosporangiales bacterium]